MIPRRATSSDVQLRNAIVLVAMSLVGCGGYGARAATPPPPRRPYDSRRPIPPDNHVETVERSGLVVGGAVLLGVGYTSSVALAVYCEPEHCSGTRGLFVPVVGPLIAAVAHERPGGNGIDYSRFWPLLMAADFGVQAAGATLVILGLTLKPKQVLVGNDVATSNVRLTPLSMGNGGSGLGLAGDW